MTEHRTPRPRAAAIIVQNGAVALIERRRDGRLYYAFPGGGVKKRETPAEAAARETEEELGLRVTVGALVAEGVINGRHESFFVAEIVGGAFGSGQGKEMLGLKSDRGTYRPVWLPITDLDHQPVLPRSVATLIGKWVRDGWPRTPYPIS
jgi:8-oxo-dGTP diphosphatase